MASEVEYQGQGFIDPLHLVDHEEAGRLGEAVQIDGGKFVAHDQRPSTAMSTGGRKLVSRALVR